MEGKWISVHDELPPINEFVLAARTQTSMGGTKYITPMVGRMNEVGSWSCAFDWVNVTHWMPLPEPPKQQNK